MTEQQEAIRNQIDATTAAAALLASLTAYSKHLPGDRVIIEEARNTFLSICDIANGGVPDES